MSARVSKKSSSASVNLFEAEPEPVVAAKVTPVVAEPAKASKKKAIVETVVEPVAAVAVAEPVKASKKKAPESVAAVAKAPEPIVETKEDDELSAGGASAPKDPAVVFGAIVRYNVKQYIKEHPLEHHETISGEGLEYLAHALKETCDDIIEFATSLLTQSKKKTFSSSEMRLGLRSVVELGRDFAKDPAISVPAEAKTKESRLQSGVLRYLKYVVNGTDVEETAKYRASRDAAAVLHAALASYALAIVRKADGLASAGAVKRLTNVHIAEARGIKIEPTVRPRKTKTPPAEVAAVAEVVAAAADDAAPKKKRTKHE